MSNFITEQIEESIDMWLEENFAEHMSKHAFTTDEQRSLYEVGFGNAISLVKVVLDSYKDRGNL